MQRVVEMCAAMALAAALAACSHAGGAGAVAPSPAKPTPAAATASASAIPLQSPTSSQSSAAPMQPASGPSLSMMLRRPTLARAFAGLHGASALPAWAKMAKSSGPSTRVEVDGTTQWLAHACAPDGCAAGELLVLADLPAHVLHGVYVETAGSAGASVGKIVWLGEPDAATTAFLKAHLSQH